MLELTGDRVGSRARAFKDTWTLAASTCHHRRSPVRTGLGETAEPSDPTKCTLSGSRRGLRKGCLTLFAFRNLTIDHIVPKSRGGTHHPDTLQLLCGACNSKKGDRPMAATDRRPDRRRNQVRKQLVSSQAPRIPVLDAERVMPQTCHPSSEGESSYERRLLCGRQILSYTCLQLSSYPSFFKRSTTRSQPLAP